MEGYKGGLIAYSVGNFLFPGMSGMPHAEESMILAVGFLRDRPLYIRPMAVLIDDQSVSLEKPGGPVLHRFLDLGRDLR
jgi:poly-gamma-glutamate synthesis protein (capsule biosynthesis protein)